MNVNLKVHPLGFLQVDPLPSQAELNEYYEKRYYQDTTSSTYQASYSDDELQYINNKIAQKAKILLKSSGTTGRLLDVGCGEGFVLAYFAKLGWSVTGVDYSDYGINTFNPGVRTYFEKGDIYDKIDEKIASAEEFDVLWLGNVLEHVLDPVALLTKLKTLLASNGSLVITVPNDGSKYQEMLFDQALVDRKWWVAYPDHLSYFNNVSLNNICISTGYKPYEILGDFPIDFFLLHSGSNYIGNGTLGKEAHHARVRMENFIAKNSIEDINNFYSSLSKIGLGRDLTIFLNPDAEPLHQG